VLVLLVSVLAHVVLCLLNWIVAAILIFCWVDLTNCFSNFSFFGSIFWVCSAVEELNSVVRRGVLSHFASLVFSRIVLS